jgi:hypothetical protein
MSQSETPLGTTDGAGATVMPSQNSPATTKPPAEREHCVARRKGEPGPCQNLAKECLRPFGNNERAGRHSMRSVKGNPKLHASSSTLPE